jgi:hypothetical protein
LAYGLIPAEAADGPEAAALVVGVGEGLQVCREPVVRAVLGAADGCFLDRAVQPLGLAVGPRVMGLGGPVLDVELDAGVVERVDEVDRGLATRGQQALMVASCLGVLRSGRL